MQFEHVDEAVTFVRQHFPKLSIQLQQATDEVPDGKVDAYVHYARAREDDQPRGAGVSDWSCPQVSFCTKCMITKLTRHSAALRTFRPEISVETAEATRPVWTDTNTTSNE